MKTQKTMFWVLNVPTPVYKQFKDKNKAKCTCPGCKALLQPTAGTSPKNKSIPIATGHVFSTARLTGQAAVPSQRVKKILLRGLERNVLKNKQAGGSGKLSGIKLAHLWLSG